MATDTINLTATKVSIDIGAGMVRDEGWLTLDIAGNPDIRHDLTQMPWPFEDESVDRLRCHHVLEHLAPQCKVPIFNEMWRVLKVGGTADIEVPVYPFVQAIADPTHLSYWHPESFDYFIRCDRDHDHNSKEFADYQHYDTKTRRSDGRRYGAVCYDGQRRLYGIKPWALVGRFRRGDGAICQVVMEKLGD